MSINNSWCCFWDTLRDGSMASGIHTVVSTCVHVLQCLAMYYMGEYYGSDRSSRLAFHYRRNEMIRAQQQRLAEQWASMAIERHGEDSEHPEDDMDPDAWEDDENLYGGHSRIVRVARQTRGHSHHHYNTDPEVNVHVASSHMNYSNLLGKLIDFRLLSTTTTTTQMTTRAGLKLHLHDGVLTALGPSPYLLGQTTPEHDHTTSATNETMFAPLFSASEKSKIQDSAIFMLSWNGVIAGVTMLLFIGIQLRNHRVLLVWIVTMAAYIAVDFCYHWLALYYLVKFKDMAALSSYAWFQLFWAAVVTFWTFRSGLHIYALFCVIMFRTEITGRSGVSKARTIADNYYYGDSTATKDSYLMGDDELDEEELDEEDDPAWRTQRQVMARTSVTIRSADIVSTLSAFASASPTLQPKSPRRTCATNQALVTIDETEPQA